MQLLGIGPAGQARHRVERSEQPAYQQLGGDAGRATHGGVRDVQQYMTQPKHILENVEYLRRDFHPSDN